MIYGYTFWSKVYHHLMKELPLGAIRNVTDYNKMKKLPNKHDLIFFLRFGKGDTKLLKHFYDEGYNLFPNPETALFISDRIGHLKEIDSFTRFPLKRRSYENISKVETISDFGKNVVMKVGNYHCGENKCLIDIGTNFPYLKYKLRKEPVLLEEFVPNSRSIRVGIVGKANDTNNIYITEHINSEQAKINVSTSWIKNINPIETNYLYDERYDLNIKNIDDIIKETRMISEKYNSDLLGVDWVVSDKKTGILELNDMIGIPDDERVEMMFKKFIEEVCINYLDKK